MTVLHAGGKFGGGGYKVSGGLHGVGASVVNAFHRILKCLSTVMVIFTIKSMKRGVPVADLKLLENTEDTGTITHFLPDREIFTETHRI